MYDIGNFLVGATLILIIAHALARIVLIIAKKINLSEYLIGFFTNSVVGFCCVMLNIMASI